MGSRIINQKDGGEGVYIFPLVIITFGVFPKRLILSYDFFIHLLIKFSVFFSFL